MQTQNSTENLPMHHRLLVGQITLADVDKGTTVIASYFTYETQRVGITHSHGSARVL